MAIPMQGAWYVQVKSKAATYQQKFMISGSDSKDGEYTSGGVYVTGDNWTVNILHKPTGGSWIPSEMQIKFPTLCSYGNHYNFDIESNDTGLDSDFNDFILTCRMLVSQEDFLIYGHVKYYDENCLFNPCFPYLVVIDNYHSLIEVLKIPEVFKAVKLFYPNRIPKAGVGSLPGEDEPEIFTPMIIPLKEHSAIPEKQNMIIRTEEIQLKAKELYQEDQTNKLVKFNAIKDITETKETYIKSALELTIADRIDLSKVLDRMFRLCDTGPLPNVMLAFQEYDRTSAELTGGSYTGNGFREDLGKCSADMNGNYIFRFKRTFFQTLFETMDTPSGGNTVTHSKPDIIGQLLDQLNINTVLYETTPKWNIPFLKRIDICVPKSKANPVPPVCKNHNHIIQSIGDTEFAPENSSGERFGNSNYLTSNGIVTAGNTNAPSVRCASWRGRLDMIGCLSKSDVKYYTVRCKKPSESLWEPIEDTLVQSKYQGSFLVSENVEVTANLKIDGSPIPISTKAFLNVQTDPQPWTELSKVTKARIYTSRYANGPTEFRIEGFKSNGTKVSNADERIIFYIDNTILQKNIDIDIHENMSMGGVLLGNCALFTLPTNSSGVVVEDAPITIRVKVDHQAGFLNNYGVYINKGAIGSIAIDPNVENAVFQNSTGPLLNSVTHRGRRHVFSSYYNCDLRFVGTDNEPGLNADGYYDMTLNPNSGSWLLPGENYCSFGINLHATLRHTDGSNGYPPATYATPVLIGIQRP